jgi:hypothetical protein
MGNAPIPSHAGYFQQLQTLQVLTLDRCSARLRELCRRHKFNWKLELKLETLEFRYWLCTEGLPEPKQGLSGSYVVGHVVREYREESGAWQFDEAKYGPDDVKELQALDFFDLLRYECEGRLMEHESNFSWESAKRVDEIVLEMQAILEQLKTLPPVEVANLVILWMGSALAGLKKRAKG